MNQAWRSIGALRASLWLSASVFLGLSLLAVFNPVAHADPGRHIIELRHVTPVGYRHMLVPRERFYHGIPVVRYYGPRYPGFGFYYDDAAAFAFLGLIAWHLNLYADLNEARLRAHEAAIALATIAPVNEDIVWNDGAASGSVKTTRAGHVADGHACREFQQSVMIAGKEEQAFGTACQQRDGSWKITDMPS